MHTCTRSCGRSLICKNVSGGLYVSYLKNISSLKVGSVISVGFGAAVELDARGRASKVRFPAREENFSLQRPCAPAGKNRHRFIFSDMSDALSRAHMWWLPITRTVPWPTLAIFGRNSRPINPGLCRWVVLDGQINTYRNVPSFCVIRHAWVILLCA